MSAAELLSDRAASHQAERLAPLAAAAAAAGVEFVIGEGNSVACGGMAGVSDTFAAALWVLDFLPHLSKRGVRLFNFHSGPDALYTPIGFEADGRLQARFGARLSTATQACVAPTRPSSPRLPPPRLSAPNSHA